MKGCNIVFFEYGHAEKKGKGSIPCPKINGASQFYVSDHTHYFEIIANMFFNEKIHLEKLNIWK